MRLPSYYQGGNISDQNMTTKLSKNLRGFLFGDKGYLSAKTIAELLKQGLHLITKVRSNMKPKPISNTNKFLLKKRGIIRPLSKPAFTMFHMGREASRIFIC